MRQGHRKKKSRVADEFYLAMRWSATTGQSGWTEQRTASFFCASHFVWLNKLLTGSRLFLKGYLQNVLQSTEVKKKKRKKKRSTAAVLMSLWKTAGLDYIRLCIQSFRRPQLQFSLHSKNWKAKQKATYPAISILHGPRLVKTWKHRVDEYSIMNVSIVYRFCFAFIACEWTRG